jgi:4-amino-4-deoxy-L-arabinose transferase-like glycosyltransferase
VGLAYVHGNFSSNREHPPLVKLIVGLGETLFGPGKVGGRLANATLVFSTGWILFFWLRREIGLIWAVVAAGMWWVLPRAVAGAGIRVDRFVYLEPGMVTFGVAAVALGWWWYRRGTWWLAALAGAFMALSVTSKVSIAFLAFSFVVLVALRRELKRGILALVAYGLAFVAVFVAVYLPAGMVSSIAYMVAFQERQRTIGHPVMLLGRRVAHPPWWANLSFTLDGFGPWLLVLLLAAAVFAFVPRTTALAVYVAVCLALLLVFYCFIAGNALPHYYYAWTWAVYVLAAIGLSSLWRLAARARARSRPGGRIGKAVWVQGLVLVALAALTVSGAVTSRAIRAERPSGFALAANVIRDHGQLAGRILNDGYPPWQFLPYLGGNVITRRTPQFSAYGISGGVYNAIAVAPTAVGDVKDFVAANSSRFDHVDLGGVDLYVPKGGATIASSGGTLHIDRTG